jgi:Ni,Fe-hydrogenase III large subunit
MNNAELSGLTIEAAVAAGWRFASLVADADELHYIFVAPGRRRPVVVTTPQAGAASIAAICPAAAWAEREVADLHGVCFAGSPDARTLVLHEERPYVYRHVEGEGVMEIRVGPIHAGIIEPGHFRFSAVGETVLGLEVRLGFVHRGVEKAALGMSPAAAIVLAERVSGTSSVAHALALARALEAALEVAVPPAHAVVRAFLLELERATNHIGDVANLCAGTALTGILAEGLIIKERLLEANQRLTGSRWLRNLVGFGGVRRLPAQRELEDALERVERAARDFERLCAKFFGSASNLERLTGTGVLAESHARALGTVGVVARASGVATDSRAELDGDDVRVVVDHDGDVAARARVRVDELAESLRLLRRLAERLPSVRAGSVEPPPARGGAGLGWAEGARGEILTYARVEAGRIARLRVRSPSRMNWPAIEHAMPGNIVPDFPLINKSFNLSYAGCDL